MTVRLMQGNEACAEGAIAAGMRFFAGYPITPSTEIAEALAERLPQVGGKFIQMEDEIASMAAVIGASLAGVKSMTATSGPGFSLKQENLGFASFCEVPCVVVNVQRAGPSTGLPTSPAQGDVMQARWGTHGDHPIIALCPWSVREAFDLTVESFNLSEALRIPVILLTDEVVGHMRERVELPPAGELTLIDRKRPDGPRESYVPFRAGPDGVPLMADFGTGYRYHVTGLTHDEHGFPVSAGPVAGALLERLHAKLERRRDDLDRVATLEMEDAEFAVFAYGGAARSAAAAVRLARAEGLRAGLFRPQVIWPFPDRSVSRLAGKVRGVLTVEMNLGQLHAEVQRVVCGRVPVVHFGRVDGELPSPRDILAALKEVARNG